MLDLMNVTRRVLVPGANGNAGANVIVPHLSNMNIGSDPLVVSLNPASDV